MQMKTKSYWMEDRQLYQAYYNMVERCYNPKSISYRYYGGRGIEMCEEWANNRDAFFEWALANGYQPGLQIDRENNDGNYEPSNCRWVKV